MNPAMRKLCNTLNTLAAQGQVFVTVTVGASRKERSYQFEYPWPERIATKLLNDIEEAALGMVIRVAIPPFPPVQPDNVYGLFWRGGIGRQLPLDELERCCAADHRPGVQVYRHLDGWAVLGV